MKLTDEELILLDGKCLPETQLVVDAAKSRLAMVLKFPESDPALSKFVADAVREAERNWKLVCRHANLRSCPVCKADAGYAPHKRNSYYHKSGTPNYDKPRTLSGKELADRFIRFEGFVSVGCCNACFERATPLLKIALATVKAEISETITGRPPRFTKLQNKKCSLCGWTGHEGQMLPVRALLGDGFYAGKCPKCGAENFLLGKQHIKTLETFTIISNAPG